MYSPPRKRSRSDLGMVPLLGCKSISKTHTSGEGAHRVERWAIIQKDPERDASLVHWERLLSAEESTSRRRRKAQMKQ